MALCKGLDHEIMDVDGLPRLEVNRPGEITQGLHPLFQCRTVDIDGNVKTAGQGANPLDMV